MIQKELIETKNTFDWALEELGYSNDEVVFVSADLQKASGGETFQKNHPDRSIQVGIAEQNLISVAAGLATCGKIPYASTFANLVSQRSCDQVFMMAYSNLSVKMIGTYAGLSAASNGGTHMSIMDISVFRNLPHMIVLDPGDCTEYHQMLVKVAEIDGPVYIRISRHLPASLDNSNEEFRIGEGKIIRDGCDACIISTGMISSEAIKAADMLDEKGISTRVVHMPTIKPLDKAIVKDCARKFKFIITAENHSTIGGLGSAVLEALDEKENTCIHRMGLQDRFGQTGSVDWLLDEYEISAKHISRKSLELIKR